MWIKRGKFVSDTKETLAGMHAVVDKSGSIVGVFDKEIDAERAARAVSLIRTISRMTQDGEEIDGKEFIMENDDAVETLNGLITDARSIVDGQEG